MSTSPNTPLLAGLHGPAKTGPGASAATNPPPAIARTAVTALGMARAGLGAVVTLFPGWTAGLIGISLDPAGAVFARAFGVRDLILGELLLTAGGNHAPDGGRREVRRMLWAGLAADAADLVIVSFAWGAGDLGGFATGSLAGLIAVSMLLGAEGLIGFK